MAGAHLRPTLKDFGLSREMRKRLRALEDTDGILRNIGEEMMPRINSRFQNEEDPDGKPWTPLHPKTVRARLRKDGNAPLTILRRRGHLAGSINYQVGKGVLRIGTGSEVEPYAATHQFGDPSRNIPARPFLGFSDADGEIIEEEIAAILDW